MLHLCDQASTVAVTLRLALPVALVFDMPSFGPSMFISFSIALSIDYIMFLLSAYRKATHSGMSNVGAVCHMLKTSGSVRRSHVVNVFASRWHVSSSHCIFVCLLLAV